MTAEILKLLKKADAKIRVPQVIPSTGEVIGYEEKYPFPELNYRQQIELLKVLIEGRWIEFAHYRKGDLGDFCYYAGKVNFKSHFEDEDFAETLAGLINQTWCNLNETDKEKIREILGGSR